MDTYWCNELKGNRPIDLQAVVVVLAIVLAASVLANVVLCAFVPALYWYCWRKYLRDI